MQQLQEKLVKGAIPVTPIASSSFHKSPIKEAENYPVPFEKFPKQEVKEAFEKKLAASQEKAKPVQKKEKKKDIKKVPERLKKSDKKVKVENKRPIVKMDENRREKILKDVRNHEWCQKSQNTTLHE